MKLLRYKLLEIDPFTEEEIKEHLERIKKTEYMQKMFAEMRESIAKSNIKYNEEQIKSIRLQMGWKDDER